MLLAGRPVSVDIGSHSVKVAQLQAGRRGVRLIRFGEQPLPPGFHWEAGGDRRLLVAAIRAALAKAGIRARSVLLALPRRQVTARIAAFPPADPGQLQRVVQYDLTDHIPFPVEQVVVDFQSLGPSREQPGLHDVLVVAAPRDFVRDYLDLAKDLGLRVAALTVDALALHDLSRRAGPGPGGVTVTLDIGRRSTTVNIAEGDRLRLTRSVAIGGQQLAAAIRDDLGLPLEEAEAQQRLLGLRLLDRQPRPPRVAAWLDNLVGEIRRSSLSFGQTVIARVFLAGGGAAIPGLAESVGGALGVAPVPMTAEGLFPEARLGGEDPGAVGRCLPAIGQALRGIGRSAWTISLVPRELLQAVRARRLRIAGVVAAVLVVMGMAAGYALASRAIASYQVEKKKLTKQAQAAKAETAAVGRLQQKRDLLRDQVKVLSAAERRRYAALELLKTISEAASPEVQIVNFAMDPGAPLTIRGTAPTSVEVADLEAALSRSPLVSEVSVERAERVTERPAAIQAPRYGGRPRSQAEQGPKPAESVSFMIKVNLRLWQADKTVARQARRGGAR